MKLYRVAAMFPEAPAAHAFQETRVKASNMGTAACRGLAALRLRDHIKGRHLETVKLTVTYLGAKSNEAD